jgi:glyoxylase-like metal-dependent hydrolase (beta-lactamase superfamily II)
MSTRIVIVFSLSMLTGNASAQDAQAVLRATAEAMGTDTVKSLQLTGSGFVGAVGQSYSSLEPQPVLNPSDDDWPRLDVTSYVRTIDYDAQFSREEMVRRQVNERARGGGMPVQGEQRQVFVVAGKYAWDESRQEPVPAPTAAEVRLLDIWLTPHGFVKAALASGNANAIKRPQGSGVVTIVSFTVLGKYRVNGTIGPDSLVDHVQTWVANPVLGDMLYETRYSEYKDFGGVKHPTRLHSHQGDFGLYPADNSQEIRLSDVMVNPTISVSPVPSRVRDATMPAVVVQPARLAEGVWLLGGGTHNSVLVEFRDFVTVVEAPQNETRSLAVIAAVRQLTAKPIRYVVNTHLHFDHSGGLRTFVAEGATVVTHERNRTFLQNVMLRPGLRVLEPDRLSMYPRAATFEVFNQRYTIADAERALELHAIQGLAHSLAMIVAYLPKEKLLINADLYTPPAAGAEVIAPTASMLTFSRNIQRLSLDVAQHVPIHGASGPGEQFRELVSVVSR